MQYVFLILALLCFVRIEYHERVAIRRVVIVRLAVASRELAECSRIVADVCNISTSEPVLGPVLQGGDANWPTTNRPEFVAFEMRKGDQGRDPGVARGGRR